MIGTILNNNLNVPDTWIFEFYCKLQEKLVGQTVRIKSLFNPHDKTPSFILYFKDSKYKFNDFSTGRQGTALELVMILYRLNEEEAYIKILEDYKKYNKGETINSEELVAIKYTLSDYKTRQWNVNDGSFWIPFGIDSKQLDYYCVKPLETYTMSKLQNNEVISFSNKGEYIYGFFKLDGTLYKIYQPKRKERKFISIESYTQGLEQLKYNTSILIISSSLKDLMSLNHLGLKLESIAPPSENIGVPKEIISSLQLKYSKIFTLFDNDDAGMENMKKYEKNYNIPGLYLKMSKDLSDSVKDFGKEKTKEYLKNLIINSI